MDSITQRANVLILNPHHQSDKMASSPRESNIFASQQSQLTRAHSLSNDGQYTKGSSSDLAAIEGAAPVSINRATQLQPPAAADQQEDPDLDAIFLRNGYKLGEKLGKGSFGVVKRVLHISSKKHMAVKIVDQNLATEEFLHKFLLRELNIIRLLKHPNIINVEKIVKIGPYTCVIMEEARKGDLLECVLRQGHLSEYESLKLFRGISNALLYCHKNNIAHRDLKCENILLDHNGEAKLSDFGFARCILNMATKKRQLSKTYCGSAAYVAPEVLKGQPYNPMMSDVWSLGVILFIMLTGLMPFDDSNLAKMLQIQIKKKWSFPTTCRDRLTSGCVEVVAKMLEPDITRRINTTQLNNSKWLIGG